MRCRHLSCRLGRTRSGGSSGDRSRDGSPGGDESGGRRFGCGEVLGDCMAELPLEAINCRSVGICERIYDYKRCINTNLCVFASFMDL